MTVASKNIIDTYAGLFEGLDALTKIELIERLSNSLKKEKDTNEQAFFKSFGAFESDRPAETMVQEIKTSGKFREKDLKF